MQAANSTLAQRTNSDGFPKAGELIEITGAHELEASDRAILNLLYQRAHDSGRLGDDRVEWEIPISELRTSRHKGNERVRDSIDRLLRVVVTVPLPDRKTGEPRILKTHLFDFFDLSADEAGEGATVRFGIPEKLRPVLARSGRWGRIKAEVVCAMTSKYAVAVYELICLRLNMERCTETFTMDRFRSLIGVPPGAYSNGKDFRRFVIEPAALEVNGLSDIGVQIELVRRHPRAPVTDVTLAWWRKQGDEFRAAMRERDASKLGRMARLRGQVEMVSPSPEPARGGRVIPPTPPQSRHAAILAELDAIGALDTDYRAAFSTGARDALKPGETWRGRLVAWVREFP